jgi:hypothetical protein
LNIAAHSKYGASNRALWRVLVAALVALSPLPASGQGTVQYLTPTWVGAPREDYVRLLQLTGAAAPSSWLLRPTAKPVILTSRDAAANPWLENLDLPDTSRHRWWSIDVFDPGVRSTFNSLLPETENSGALWAGRGLSGIVEGGVMMRLGPARLTLAPSAVYAQNRDFPLAPLGADVLAHGYTPYANPYFTAFIDFPQRLGGSAISRLDAGQSGLQVDALGLSLGASMANQWWGPGAFNSVLMTNNAPGFRHVFLGSAHPYNIWIGKLEGKWIVGRLQGSRVSTTQPDVFADRRWLNGLGLIFAPRFAPSLYVGAIRVFYSYLPQDGLHFRDLLDIFEPVDKHALRPSQLFSDAADQMLTLIGRWVLPSSGIEVYGEWARNDHSWDTRDFLLDPTHASSYLIGLQKVFVTNTGFYRVGLESIDLPAPPGDERRDVPTFYIHPQIVEGYTERGRLIGASIGPVGAGQYARFDAYRDWGRLGGMLALIQHPDYRFGPSTATPMSTAFTLSGTRFVGRLSWDAAITYERQLNQYYQPHADVSNVRLQLGAAWRFGPTRE